MGPHKPTDITRGPHIEGYWFNHGRVRVNEDLKHAGILTDLTDFFFGLCESRQEKTTACSTLPMVHFGLPQMFLENLTGAQQIRNEEMIHFIAIFMIIPATQEHQINDLIHFIAIFMICFLLVEL